MHFTRDMQNEYLKALHKDTGAPELPVPCGTKSPIHGKHYAFCVQLILNIAVALTVVGYMALMAP